MKAAFYTLGCKVNQYESQAMEELFRRRGYEIVPPAQEADLYIVNSCTVTSSGDKKTRQIVRRLRREHPLAVVALTGCLPQTDPHAAEELPEADLVLGTRERRAALGDEDHTRAFLKIQDGCTQFCAYCIIPYARGPLRSKKLSALREEVAGLAAAGYREVVLTGINLSLYGRELGLRLPDAVEAAASVPGIDRVRIGSLEPELLTDADIARLAAVPQLCGQFHLSLQSGCDATLARMNRHYTTARYREIAGALREKFPGCAITTDVITGFPGETPGEFAETCGFVREMGFAMVHIFPYSERRGTAAASMPDPVPMEERRRRASELAEITAGSARAFYEAQVGAVQMVLIEKKREPDWVRGYTPNYTPVRVRCADDRRGELLPVRITEAGPEGCTGVFAG